ncbi:hypothetical protein KCU88_g2058, partial [Aureobasidium melanogenum]
MPVYLVHGFRWPREGFTGIRVHAVVHNLDDCSVEYIQNEHSRAELLKSFRKTWPEIMKELDGPATTGRDSRLEFIEQYEPDDLESPNAVSQPYAFVGDKVVMIAAKPGTTTTAQTTGVSTPTMPSTPKTPGSGSQQQQQQSRRQPVTSPKSTTTPSGSVGKKSGAAAAAAVAAAFDPTALSINIDEVIAQGPGTSAKAWEAFADLRDKLAEGEKIGWWVVYNGDPERSYDDDEDELDEEYEDEEVDQGEDTEEYYEDTHQKGHVPYSPQQQKQRIHRLEQELARAQTPRPRTAPQAADEANSSSTSTIRASQQPTRTGPLPHIAAQQQHQQHNNNNNLTALPVRPSPPVATALAAATRSEKGKQKESIPEPGKLKETARSQGLRKKFFGKRL